MSRPICLALLVCAACGDDAIEPPPPAGVEAIYASIEESALTPYPSDRYSVEDPSTPTGRRLAIVAADVAANDLGALVLGYELDRLDGFSVAGGVITSYSGALALDGLAVVHPPDGDDPRPPPTVDASAFTDPETSPLVLIDIDPSSPDRGRLHGLVLNYWEQPADGYYAKGEFSLVAQPAEPLREQNRYAFAVTDALRAADGGEVRRSALMDELIQKEFAVTHAYNDAVRASLEDLEAAGVASDRVRLATVFTTGSVHGELAAAAANMREEPPPALLEPWTIEIPLEADGRIRYRAVFESPEYRSAEDELFVVEAGSPIPQSSEALEVFAAFSDAATDVPRTVVIFGHGLGGDKDGCWGTAERLASLNVAVFSIDSPHHGSRAPAGASQVDNVFGFFGVDIEANAVVISKARDNFRQMALDQLELVRLIGSLDTLDILPPGAPDGVPDLDTSRMLYIGHSFGGVQGPTIFALAPEITQAVWNVGGGNVTTLMRDSGTFGLLNQALTPDGVAIGAVGRFFAVAQGLVDAGDPVNYARYGTLEPLPGVKDWSPRDVLLQEVIADTIVPNSSSRALARAAGLTLVDAIEPISGLASAAAPLSENLDSGATGVISQFDRINDGELAIHGELIFAPEGRQQYLEFFESGLTRGHAVVVAPY